MITINKYILDFDKTYEEFLFHINADRTLSVEIIKAMNFREGTFFTILEGEAFTDDLYEPESTGNLQNYFGKRGKTVPQLGTAVNYKRLSLN